MIHCSSTLIGVEQNITHWGLEQEGASGLSCTCWSFHFLDISPLANHSTSAAQLRKTVYVLEQWLPLGSMSV